MTNIILNTDSYKVSHFKQYPPKSEYVSSYIESRGGEYDETVFFGLQVFIKENLLTPFTARDIDEAEEVITAHGLEFNREGWEHILRNHNGYLPISIRAVPEGTVVPVSNVLVEVVNTDPHVPWLTSYVETALLRAVWYPTTIATHSREIKKVIKKYMDMTSDNVEAQLPFKLHDFGARGVSSEESAMLGGMAHLINFSGTDTLSAIMGARKYYDEPMAGFSIPASEHSTMTAWGRDNESAAYANMLEKFSEPGAIVACVSDSYDIFNAIENIWGDELKEKVISSGGTLVVRPDSMDPVTTPVKCVELLMERFGSVINSKDYHVLPDCVRVIQGDGIGIKDIDAILTLMEEKGLAAENMAFGCGGGLLQKVNRDTLKFAMKASAICVDGEWRDVYKEPVGQSDKVSKRGRLSLAMDKGTFTTLRTSDLEHRDLKDCLQTVYQYGEIRNEQTFAEIRERASL